MVVVGIDEVGRGCWAGPLVAGAVILKKGIPGLTDSKLLSKMKREQLAPMILQSSLAYGLGWVSAEELDTIGLEAAVQKAMQAALQQITISYDQIIIDGKINYLPNEKNVSTIIKADLTIPSVSAASIIAKVARDTYMVNISNQYPEYGFDKHVGYGTKAHQEALKQYGVIQLHRKTYKPIRALL